MSRDVRELLHDTAHEPTRPVNASDVVDKANRQTLVLRAAAVVAAVGFVAVAVVGANALLDTGVQPPEIVGQPPPETSRPVDGQTLTVGGAAMDVPSDWRLASDEGGQECLDRLFVDGPVVYVRDGAPDVCTEQVRTTAGLEPGVYVFPQSDGKPMGLVGYGQPFGDVLTSTTVNGFEAMTTTEHGQMTYLAIDQLDVILIVAQRDSDVVNSVLATLRPVDVASTAETAGEADVTNPCQKARPAQLDGDQRTDRIAHIWDSQGQRSIVRACLARAIDPSHTHRGPPARRATTEPTPPTLVLKTARGQAPRTDTDVWDAENPRWPGEM